MSRWVQEGCKQGVTKSTKPFETGAMLRPLTLFKMAKEDSTGYRRTELQAHQKITGRDHVTAEKMRNAYLNMNHGTLLMVFRQHNEDCERQVGKPISHYINRQNTHKLF